MLSGSAAGVVGSISAAGVRRPGRSAKPTPISDRAEHRRRQIASSSSARLSATAAYSAMAATFGKQSAQSRRIRDQGRRLHEGNHGVVEIRQIDPLSITIPEGLTVGRLSPPRRGSRLEWRDADRNPGRGSLRPDTCKFSRGTKRARDRRADAGGAGKAGRPDLGKARAGAADASKEEFVTLASIVEKETGKADERAPVASVFINRLAAGMRLQSDPTVIYGLFGGNGKPADRPIYQSDIQKETPFNTYEVRGLPPGPIANPGRAALEAVANPSQDRGSLFRRRRHRRPCVRGDAGRAQ